MWSVQYKNNYYHIIGMYAWTIYSTMVLYYNTSHYCIGWKSGVHYDRENGIHTLLYSYWSLSALFTPDENALILLLLLILLFTSTESWENRLIWYNLGEAGVLFLLLIASKPVSQEILPVVLAQNFKNNYYWTTTIIMVITSLLVFLP